MDELTRDDVFSAVDRCVDELLDIAVLLAPPVDAIRLAQQHLGMNVYMDREQPQRGRAQRSGGKKQIYLRPEPREERHQWTVAHEIGEHYKPRILELLRIEPSEARPFFGESLANLFAYHLLVPARWLADDARTFEFDILALKNRYLTASHEVVALRLLDLPEPCIITIVDNDTIYKRKLNTAEWRIRRKLEPAETKCQARVRDTGEPHVVRENGWTVHGWPVHKADWKREILRSVIEDGF